MAQEEVNKGKKVMSLMKRVKSNHPTLPRAKAPRSLSNLTQALTKAGYDPSKIEERAILLAKAAGAKRKRDEDEDMDVDEGQEDEDWEDESEMEVDEDSPRKKARTEKGSRVVAVDRRARTDRSLAGLGGPEVRLPLRPATAEVTDRRCVLKDIVKVRKMYAMQAKKFRKTGKKNEADTHIPDLKVRGSLGCFGSESDIENSVSRNICSPGNAASKRTGDNAGSGWCSGICRVWRRVRVASQESCIFDIIEMYQRLYHRMTCK